MVRTERFVCFLQFRFCTTATKKTETPKTLFPSKASSISSYTAEFLNNSCGLPLETALKASLKLQLKENDSKNHESIITFLKSHGFSNTHFAKIIQKEPRILKFQLDKTIKPKIDFFVKNGLSGLLLAELIAAKPIILGRSLRDHLEPSYTLLKMYLETNEKVVLAVKRDPWLLSSNPKVTLQPNIDFLIREGTPISNVSKFILHEPRVLLDKADKVVSAVLSVKKMGFEPATSAFRHAIWVKVSLNDSTWNKKLDLFKSFGWSDEDIMCAFKNHPLCLACSEVKIKGAMDFFTNTMKLEKRVLVSNPALLLYALETRIRPRYKLLKFLESKKLIKKSMKIVWMIMLGEKKFLEKYVTKHLDQFPDLMEIYRSTSTAC